MGDVFVLLLPPLPPRLPKTVLLDPAKACGTEVGVGGAAPALALSNMSRTELRADPRRCSRLVSATSASAAAATGGVGVVEAAASDARRAFAAAAFAAYGLTIAGLLLTSAAPAAGVLLICPAGADKAPSWLARRCALSSASRAFPSSISR